MPAGTRRRSSRRRSRRRRRRSTVNEDGDAQKKERGGRVYVSGCVCLSVSPNGRSNKDKARGEGGEREETKWVIWGGLTVTKS